MRIFNLLTIGFAVNAQYNSASTGSELTDAIFKSLMFCHEWINNVSCFQRNWLFFNIVKLLYLKVCLGKSLPKVHEVYWSTLCKC